MSKISIMSKRQLSDRMEIVTPFHVMRLMGAAKAMEEQGHHVVHMEVGEPDFETPAPILQAAQQFLDGAHVHYTPAAGLPLLRETIAHHYQQHHGLSVDSSRVLITPGASGALMVALASLINPGDEVLLSDPGYPCNANFVRLLGGVPRALPVGAECHYHLHAELVEREWGDATRGVLMASPSNPTGTLIPEPQWRALAQTVDQRDGFILSDEIYHGLVYDAEASCALAEAPDAFILNSFSKYFGMTGWRLGWLVVPEWATTAAEKLMQNLFIAAPTPAQHAALVAFEPETTAILEGRRGQFQQRRDRLYDGLRDLGFTLGPPPQGAFYLYADVSHFTDDSEAFAQDLLQHARVALTPGLDFGAHRAAQHIRFAYTTSLDEIERGLARIDRFLAQRQ